MLWVSLALLRSLAENILNLFLFFWRFSLFFMYFFKCIFFPIFSKRVWSLLFSLSIFMDGIIWKINLSSSVKGYIHNWLFFVSKWHRKLIAKLLDIHDFRFAYHNIWLRSVVFNIVLYLISKYSLFGEIIPININLLVDSYALLCLLDEKWVRFPYY